jgi:hypothetical protein
VFVVRTVSFRKAFWVAQPLRVEIMTIPSTARRIIILRW